MTDQLHALLADTAAAYAAAGCSVVPAQPGKRPFGRWTEYQHRPMPERALRAAFATGQYDGLGIICGPVSGNVEMFEAEGRAVREGIIGELATQLDKEGHPDLLPRLSAGHLETTPSGGMHWLYRVDGPDVARNTALARRPATPDELEAKPEERFKVLLETRGTGGFTVLAPSAGRTHLELPGGVWALLAGGPGSIPTITPDERDALHRAARALDQQPEQTCANSFAESSDTRAPSGNRTSATAGCAQSTAFDAAHPPTTHPPQGRPGDDYNARTSWADILQPHGWRPVGRTRNGGTSWVRPGKEARDGISATTDVATDGVRRFYVFSTSAAPFETEKPYTPFAVYALLEHGGNHAAAAAELRRRGYGDPRPDAFAGLTTKGTTWNSPNCTPSDTARHASTPPSSDANHSTSANGASSPSPAAATTTGFTPTTPTTQTPSTAGAKTAETVSTTASRSGASANPLAPSPQASSPAATPSSSPPGNTLSTSATTPEPSSSMSLSGASAQPTPSPSHGTPVATRVTDCEPRSSESSTSPAATSDAPTTGATGENPVESGEPTERTSWWPRDLTPVIAGHDDIDPPDILPRQDGHRLLYRGKVNGLIGESESGKTWVALYAALCQLQVAERVLVLDFESTPTVLISRLRALGATDNHLQHLQYVGPDEALHAAARDDLTETLERHTPDVVVLDGVNAAMTLLALDINDNGDCTKFDQLLLRPIARRGACVVIVDHLPKNADTRGKGAIGAQAKRAMMTGTAIRVEVLTEFGRGMTGRLKLVVDKNRDGHVRAISANAKEAGTFILESHSDGTARAYIDAPDMRSEREQERERDDDKWARIMEQVSRELEAATYDIDGELSQRKLEALVPHRADDVREALRRLVKASCATVRDGARGSLMYRSTKPYRVPVDPSGGVFS